MTPSRLLLGLGDTMRRSLSATLAVLCLSASAIAAQDNSRPIRVVLLDTMSSPGIAVVIRRDVGANGQDLIAIKRKDLAPERIAAALARLANERTSAPVPEARRMITISESIRHRPLSMSERAVAQSLITRLLAAPRVDIPRVGNVPMLHLTEAELKE